MSIELAHPINRATVEATFRWMNDNKLRGHQCSEVQQGISAARARDPKLMAALEKGAEVLEAMVQEQYGRTLRDPGTSFGMRVVPTEAASWREAYATADRGAPELALGWIYACAGKLAGVVT